MQHDPFRGDLAWRRVPSASESREQGRPNQERHEKKGPLAYKGVGVSGKLNSRWVKRTPPTSLSQQEEAKFRASNESRIPQEQMTNCW